MTKIVNLRGTSGSGKSTVAFTFLKNFPHVEILNSEGKVNGYRIDASPVLKAPIHLLGKYTTACGGCDQIPEQQMAADRAIDSYNAGAHVLMEGLLASAAGPKGAVTKTISETGNAVFAILDTSLETCIERVQARRLARGDERPFNPKNTTDKWNQTRSTAKTLFELGYDVRPIDHTRAYEDVLAIFKEAESE